MSPRRASPTLTPGAGREAQSMTERVPTQYMCRGYSRDDLILDTCAAMKVSGHTGIGYEIGSTNTFIIDK